MNSVRNRLAALFFVITAAAIGFIYLYVLPPLRSSLTAEKLQRLEQVGTDESGRLAAAMRRGASEEELRRLVRGVAQRTDARVTLLGVRTGSAGPQPQFVVSDSQFERTAILPDYPVAAAAATSGRVGSAVEEVAGKRTGEMAVPLFVHGRPRWVAVLSTPLGDVDDNVALIRRQILIAGMIALAAALAAGWLAARAHAKRLRRLEAAAEKVADGDFSTPIPDEGTDEVGQLASTLNEMQQRLARLDNARNEFIANASHELRTPIFSLGGFVELLEHEDPGPKKRKEFIKTMSEQVSRLEKLTTDLLDLSRLDAEEMEMHLESVDLVELARAITAEFRPLARRRRHKLELRLADKPVLARCDPDRAAQILRILLDNALIHTPRGTKVTVTATRSAKGAELVVGDEGRGLDRRSLERVFDRFYSGDSSGGTGLGLSIADELAARMEGEVEAVSKRGYTAFTLRLPAAPKKKTKAAAGAKG
jgi:two-component system OmpR family sensor kinase